jgi:hypothetical protein
VSPQPISAAPFLPERFRLLTHPFLEAVANGSAVSWQHINLLGEYDFSDEKLQDTVGIKPPKLEDQRDTFLGGAKRAELQGRNGLR